jgi:hypothetical protein
MILFAFIIVMGCIAIAIVYFLTLQNTLKAIRPQNRKMEPGQVWLGIIPLFGIVWHFIIVKKLSNSIYAELTSRSLPCNKEPTYNIGLAFSILACFTPFDTWLGPLGSFITIITLILWIIYWVKIVDYKKQLEMLPPYKDDDSLIFR